MDQVYSSIKTINEKLVCLSEYVSQQDVCDLSEQEKKDISKNILENANVFNITLDNLIEIYINKSNAHLNTGGANGVDNVNADQEYHTYYHYGNGSVPNVTTPTTSEQSQSIVETGEGQMRGQACEQTPLRMPSQIHMRRHRPHTMFAQPQRNRNYRPPPPLPLPHIHSQRRDHNDHHEPASNNFLNTFINQFMLGSPMGHSHGSNGLHRPRGPPHGPHDVFSHSSHGFPHEPIPLESLENIFVNNGMGTNGETTSFFLNIDGNGFSMGRGFGENGLDSLDSVFETLNRFIDGGGSDMEDVTVPLNQDILANITSKPFGSIENSNNFENCSICLCDFENDVFVRQLPCKHVYHTGCIDRWFQEHSNCPVCRTDMRDT